MAFATAVLDACSFAARFALSHSPICSVRCLYYLLMTMFDSRLQRLRPAARKAVAAFLADVEAAAPAAGHGEGHGQQEEEEEEEEGAKELAWWCERVVHYRRRLRKPVLYGWLEKSLVGAGACVTGGGGRDCAMAVRH